MDVQRNFTPTCSESELVGRVRAGDRSAIADLYRLHARPMFRHLLGMLGERQAAEDAVQEIFIKAIEKIDAYQQGQGPFAAWLHRLAKNHAIDELRRRQRLRAVREESGLEGANSAMADLLAASEPWLGESRLRALVRLLPQSQQRVLFLRFAAGFDPPEVAGLLKLTPAAVRQQQRRAIKSLQNALTG